MDFMNGKCVNPPETCPNLHQWIINNTCERVFRKEFPGKTINDVVEFIDSDRSVLIFSCVNDNGLGQNQGFNFGQVHETQLVP